MSMPEKPIHATIVSRFDLGFIVQCPDGRSGQLRVPEMSPTTAQWDRSAESEAGIGNAVDVYVLHKNDSEYLFSEFSAEQRSARAEKQEAWIIAQEQATIGETLHVRIERKLQWGCLCRQEAEPFLEGVIATSETVASHQLPTQCAVSEAEWNQLTEGEIVRVTIFYKQWAQWRYLLYFTLQH